MTEVTNAWKSIALAALLLFISACDTETHQPTISSVNDANSTQSVDAAVRNDNDGAHKELASVNDDKVSLMTVEIGGPYTDDWSGKLEEKPDVSEEDGADSSTTLVTLYRVGKSGDFEVGMLINCKERKYTYQNAIEFGSFEVPENEIIGNIPPELPDEVIKTFCR